MPRCRSSSPRRTTGLSRRGLLGAVAATAAMVTLATVGQTLPALRRLSLLAPRDPRVGPQGLPVNKSAVATGVGRVDPAYQLVVEGPHRTVLLSLADLAAAVDGGPGDPVVVESLEPKGRYRTSVLDPSHAQDPLTLLALRLHGEPLHLDHGYPCRLIAPNRPGVLQTKWVGRLTVGGAP